MKTFIRRVFGRNRAPAPSAHSAVSSELTTSDIETYYLRVIADCLHRMLVAVDAIETTVKRSGTGPTGLIAFAGYVRILKWDPVVMPVLLQNLPVIDRRIRKLVDASVILEGTHFSGLWFQATSDTAGSPSTLVGLPTELIHQPVDAAG
jgi:hypothetical protein